MNNLYLKFSNGNIYCFENGVYVVATVEYLNSHITKYICANANSSKKSNARAYVQDVLFNNSIDRPNSNYVGFKNGLYDLKNRKFISHSPDIFLINQLNINYLEDLPDTNLEVDTYVDEIMFHNRTRKKGFLQIVGYCLTSKNDLQVMFLWYGPTASNGKSSATDIITRMVGRNNICHISLDEFSGKFAKTGIADKLLNITTEVTNKKITDTAVLKQTVTGDLIEGNIKHVQKRPVIQSYAKHIVCTNDFPEVNDNNDGYFRRLNMLLFENKFDPKTSSFDLDDFCTQKNLDYLGNLAFRHYLDACKEDEFVFANAEESANLVMQYRDINDTIKGYLNDEDSIVNIPNFDLKRTIVLENYRKYCKENKRIPLPKKQFYKEILEKSDIQEYYPDGFTKFRRKPKEDTDDRE